MSENEPKCPKCRDGGKTYVKPNPMFRVDTTPYMAYCACEIGQLVSRAEDAFLGHEDAVLATLELARRGFNVDSIGISHFREEFMERWTAETDPCKKCGGTGRGVEWLPSGVFSGKKLSSPCSCVMGRVPKTKEDTDGNG